jgi:large subunit ribosomal protein L4e
MKAKILDIHGKEKGEIELPKCFSVGIREDIVAKVLEAKKSRQPYSPSPVAGKQHSAKGKLKHLRHVWKSQYGRGISRVPRKILSRRGGQFIWQAAEAPQARGGMRAHPPKVLSMVNSRRINKKEMELALASALSATANKKQVAEKYSTLREIKNLPLVVEPQILSLKAKELLSGLKNILGEMFNVGIKKKGIRAGKGRKRGRKYKSSAGLLLVVGENEKLKTSAFEVKRARNLSTTDLAKGGLGRITIYTEKAIKELGEKLE